MIEPKLPTDGRNLLGKVEQLKEWRKTLDEKLEVVEKLVDDIENIVADMQEWSKWNIKESKQK